MLGGRILRNIFRRNQRSQRNGIPALGQTIVLDYPVKASPRYGYGKPPHQPILRILEAGRNEYAKRLSGFCKLNHAGDPKDISAAWMPLHFTACSWSSDPKNL
jgi:hypothetical protein